MKVHEFFFHTHREAEAFCQGVDVTSDTDHDRYESCGPHLLEGAKEGEENPFMAYVHDYRSSASDKCPGCGKVDGEDDTPEPTKAELAARAQTVMPICPNCGQWQSRTLLPPRGFIDCVNQCAWRELAPRVRCCPINDHAFDCQCDGEGGDR